MKKFLDNLTRVLGGDRMLGTISGSSDLILAGLIIAIIMMLIFPVAPHVIDVLIAINLSVSIIDPLRGSLYPESGPTLDVPLPSAHHDPLPPRGQHLFHKANPPPRQRGAYHLRLRKLRRRRQLCRRRSDLPDHHDRPVHRRHEGRGKGSRGRRPLYLGRHAG